MERARRNDPCPCGNGFKAKHCCLAKESALLGAGSALLHMQSAQVEVLAELPEAAIRQLFEEMLQLPRRELGLQCRLPDLMPAEIERAMQACRAQDSVAFAAALASATPLLDDPQRRLELATAVLELRDRQQLSAELAAVCVLDLNSDPSGLLNTAVTQAIAVRSGTETTPAGLVLPD